jgi:hypothetical protein
VMEGVHAVCGVVNALREERIRWRCLLSIVDVVVDSG